jgi:uncharacterized beta barrel domain-containing protein DUF5777
MRLRSRLWLVLLVCGMCATPALAQGDDDAVLKPAEPDFTLIGLPTSLRLPLFKSAFRVTHRFLRPLGQGDFGDLASDLFGLDNGAAVGLEYRFGIIPNGQIGINRSSSGQTIELFGQYGVLRQSKAKLDLSAWVSVEGTNNLQDNHSPTLGAIVSRTLSEWAAVYIEPMWVNNSNPLPGELVDHNNTTFIGLGARVRIRPTVYLTADAAPRVAGFESGVDYLAFAIEKRAGGHMFQLNFSNSVATTMGQFAHGGLNREDWHLGFNITRKFF